MFILKLFQCLVVLSKYLKQNLYTPPYSVERTAKGAQCT